MMALQGSLFKFVSNFSQVRTVLSHNRNALINHQPHATLKKSTKEQLEALKLPEKPKRPLNPYMRFVNEHRPEILKTHADLKATDVIKICAVDWAKLHETTKEKYTKEFRAEMEVYAEKSKAYLSKLTDEQKEGIGKAREERKNRKKRTEIHKIHKETEKPKRPIGAYIYFAMELAKKENKPYKDVVKNIKGKWGELPEAEIKRFKDMYDADKLRYEKEMVDWEARMIKEGHVDLVRGKSLNTERPTRLTDKDE